MSSFFSLFYFLFFFVFTAQVRTTAYATISRLLHGQRSVDGPVFAYNVKRNRSLPAIGDCRMKRIVLGVVALGLVVGALLISKGLGQVVEDKNPWTHLRFNDSADNYHFAIVSDRTGGHRARVFSEAVDRLNLMQPAFVVSVGDLIEGYSKD